MNVYIPELIMQRIVDCVDAGDEGKTYDSSALAIVAEMCSGIARLRTELATAEKQKADLAADYKELMLQLAAAKPCVDAARDLIANEMTDGSKSLAARQRLRELFGINIAAAAIAKGTT